MRKGSQMRQSALNERPEVITLMECAPFAQYSRYLPSQTSSRSNFHACRHCLQPSSQGRTSRFVREQWCLHHTASSCYHTACSVTEAVVGVTTNGSSCEFSFLVASHLHCRFSTRRSRSRCFSISRHKPTEIQLSTYFLPPQAQQNGRGARAPHL